ncbi:MAG: outer membrane beta-barrel protein [Candidatus Brocadiia bacterium]
MKYLAIAFALVAALSFSMGSASASSFEIGAKIGYWTPKDTEDSVVPYGIIGQFDINETWAVRLDAEMGTADDVDFTSFVLSGVFNFPMSEETSWRPYVRAGVGSYGADDGTNSESAFGYEAALGIGYLYQNWTFFVEAGYRGASLEPVPGTDVKLDGIIAFFGVMYKF